MTDIYIGIDPGVKNCAVIGFSPTRAIVTAWKPKGTVPTGVQRLSFLIQSIKGQLDTLSKVGDIRCIAMEGYSMLEKFGQHAAGEVGGAIKLGLVGWFGLHNSVAYPVLVQPQQLKKFVSGSGNTPKAIITKEVLKRWGVDFNDTNLADAYGLARLAYAFHEEPEMPAFQRQVIDALQGRTEWVPPARKLLRRPMVASG